MKMMRTQIRLLIVTLLLSVLAFSCSQDNKIEPDKNSKLQTNEQEYHKIINARSTYSGTTFEITKVTREGDLMKIDVEGGCDIANYKIVWSGIALMSYPMQTGIVVNYEDKVGETCTDKKKFTLEVDMLKLFGTTDIIVHVANGSKVKDISVDPDGSVSNR
ncbi:hypothetical protein D0T08_18045 [Emticicia sp. C21]|nr:hypothetical protein D0T08_18045 [Emticicia sp. C21]